jgi:hypothetical protein
MPKADAVFSYICVYIHIYMCKQSQGRMWLSGEVFVKLLEHYYMEVDKAAFI